jgi:hypothetical protein
MADSPTGPGGYRQRAGLGNEASYVVSGKPFASGSINAMSGTAVRVAFPNVTRWVQIMNQDDDDGNYLLCAFSENGLATNNYFTLQDRASSTPGHTYLSMEVKCTEMWFTGSADFDVIAGLTGIGVNEINHDGVINWSGSSGVG